MIFGDFVDFGDSGHFGKYGELDVMLFWILWRHLVILMNTVHLLILGILRVVGEFGELYRNQ